MIWSVILKKDDLGDPNREMDEKQEIIEFDAHDFVEHRNTFYYRNKKEVD